MTKDITIHRRPDGSIDTDHFVREGRVERGNAAKHIFTKVAGGARSLTAILAGLLVIFLLHSGQGQQTL